MVRRDVRHDGIAAIVDFDPVLVVDPGTAGPRRLHQRHGIPHRLAEGHAVCVNNHAPLYAEVKLALLVILGITRRHFAVGGFVIAVQVSAVAGRMAVALLHPPTEVIVCQRGAVQANALAGVMLAVVKNVIDPGIAQPVFQRNGDVEAEGLLVHPRVIVLLILNVFAQGIVDTVTDAVPAAVIADAQRGHALVAMPVILFHQT
ncbi:hypothetical protein D3C75_512640 [compost metagenome]